MVGLLSKAQSHVSLPNAATAEIAAAAKIFAASHATAPVVATASHATPVSTTSTVIIVHWSGKDVGFLSDGSMLSCRRAIRRTIASHMPWTGLPDVVPLRLYTRSLAVPHKVQQYTFHQLTDNVVIDYLSVAASREPASIIIADDLSVATSREPASIIIVDDLSVATSMVSTFVPASQALRNSMPAEESSTDAVVPSPHKAPFSPSRTLTSQQQEGCRSCSSLWCECAPYDGPAQEAGTGAQYQTGADAHSAGWRLLVVYHRTCGMEQTRR